ncbi:uroporphyrinogen-III C-methyltransferase [Sphingomonas sp. A2-49]|uniref:uroporphyrinogen-III C-methyltransferase n=1 Tax=Sphingomonas sp. A2-49 TaxID=1391375 RepID=UPI0021D2911D|nr:uroporphyrinogen-III C-methyltransferase [Sphingomonas sp. A2-49]MCU6455488.1 uroporphyrinogen-III C-methyltransferase [Sphingomonas sp. A2-49]
MSHDVIARGSVWLVGAGPGDPDLLTRKAERLIAAADIVFHDALVGPGVLALIPPGVARIGVGKRSGRHSKDQATIDALIVAAARRGRRVVRLKGGDPSIFGRSTEEIDACIAHGIPVHVCPGITAASAAAASATLSLTLRGLARSLTFVTAHARAGEPLDLDWAALAHPRATLAVYMGRAAAAEVARELIGHGLPRDTPVAIAVNVSLPDERLIHGRLDALAFLVRTIGDRDPALLLIGAAMGARGRVGATDDETVCSRDIRDRAPVGHDPAS